MSDDADLIARIQKLLALAGNNPSRAEAAAAWDKAQAMLRALKGKPASDAALRDWFMDAAAPCPWVIQVSADLGGREYFSVVRADMLVRDKQAQALPMWRLVQVPLAFRGLDAGEILQACYDGRIAWRDLAAPTGGPAFRYQQAIAP